MSKKLLIVRHAKSDWGNARITDFNRPINERGKTNAPIMGKRLKEKGILPDAVISSPALRAITTAKLFTHELGFSAAKIKQEKLIYEASCSSLLKIINDFDNAQEMVALFGHNNGITDLAVYLTDAEIFNIPTSGMVMINFPFDDWKMVGKNTGEVEFFDYPKNLENIKF
jgi:phosphohistidine phosphatase